MGESQGNAATPLTTSDRGIVDQLRRTIQAYRHVERRVGHALGLNTTDTSALEIIGRHGQITPSRLAEELHLTLPGVTFVITRLSEAGVIQRHLNPADKRSSLLSLTPHTKTVVRDRIAHTGALIAEHFFRHTPDEQRIIMRFLSEVETAFSGHR